jgi:HAD superfamily hydrolase (TIGR01549 family)
MDGVGFSHFLGELAIAELALSLAGNAGKWTDAQVLLTSYREAVLATYEADEDLVPLRSGALARWIERLREVGVQRVGILSNERRWAPRIYVEQVMRVPLGTFDPVLTSDELGFEKPDRRAFQAIVKAIDLPATACLFVGDSLERDVLPALAFGMQARLATWFARSGRLASGPVRELQVLADLPESIGADA